VSSDTGFEIYEELVKTCADNSGKIHVWPDAVKDADYHFRLENKSDIISFIGNRGLKEVRFLEKKPLESNKRKELEIIVFSFEFKARKKIGYLAFYKSPVNDNFVIKSFHLSHRQVIGDVSKSPQFLNTLKSIGLSKSALKRMRSQNEQ
jgi:hypothetical protein